MGRMFRVPKKFFTKTLLFACAVMMQAHAARCANLSDDVPDFSRAGYHAGRRPLPILKPTHRVTDYGGVADGKTDATEAIRRAIMAASEKGGVVYLDPGRWLVTNVIAIAASHVVLQGAGSDKTTLVCPKSLSEMRKPHRQWSWSGGLIEVAPSRESPVLVGEISEAAEAGSTRLAVVWNGTQRAKPGEWLEMLWDNDRETDSLLNWLYGGLVPRNRMGNDLKGRTAPRTFVRIARTTDNAVDLVHPLPLPARPEWRTRLTRRPFLTEVGIEGLTIEFPETSYPGHLREKGYNAVQLRHLVNGWVRDLSVFRADSGIFVGPSHYVTVTDIVFPGNRTMHHPLCVCWGSNNLITRWRIETPHVHGTTLSWYAHSNVFSHGYGRDLKMDAHRAASFRNLHTQIVIDHGRSMGNPFASGGAGNRGPHSARGNVYWNIENRFDDPNGDMQVAGFGEWPMGVFVGWHGNRPLIMKPIERMKQQVRELNAVPAIVNLHEHQVRMRR